MIIIADSGSTKTSWAVLKNDEEPQLFATEGYNPYYVDSAYIQESVNHNFSHHVNTEEVEELHFYGAGCAGGKDEIVKIALAAIFPNAVITIESDLLAAAKSALGDKEGFISILGTGTNTAIYSDGQIISQVNSLGFLLGDEGSGAYLGKKLLAQFARKALPLALMEEFEATYDLNPDKVVPAFYDVNLQNRYSAKFTVFLHQHIDHPYIKEMVEKAFTDFFENIVCLYPNYQSYALNSIGSIGIIFAEQLKVVANTYGMKIGKITKSPMQGLIDYHQNHTSSLKH